MRSLFDEMGRSDPDLTPDHDRVVIRQEGFRFLDTNRLMDREGE